MNQKTKYTLRTYLGAVFAALLINPLASYAGTWSNQGGPNQWKYDLGDGSYAADGWYWIDSDQDGMEECYYFDKKGQLLAGTRTPDGFQVDSDGRWTVNGMVKQRETPPEDLTTGIHETADGLIYRNESGELTKNGWQNANNNWYYFDSDGYAVKGWQYIDGYKFYFDETSCSLIQDLEGILAAPSFRITVDRSRCQVTVYAPDGDNGYIIPYRTFICSPGKSSTPTPVGTFKLTNKYLWHALVESTYGQYCSRLGNTSILFHSVPGKTTSIYNIPAEEYNKLGEPASHGCIRMTVADCKWIYDHCASGTVVTVGDNLAAPFERPAAEKIPAEQNWDPTDPEVEK